MTTTTYFHPTTTIADPQLASRAENAQAQAWYALHSGFSEQYRQSLGIAVTRLGGGAVTSVRDDPTEYWSQVLGLGVTEPITARLMADIVAFYEAEGTASATIHIAPALLPPDWTAIAGEFGLIPGPELLKMAAPLDRIRATGQTRLRVGRARPEDADEWIDVLMRMFDVPDALTPVFTTLFESPVSTPFAAWDGDRMVAVANLARSGRTALLCSATTLPGHRGLGAQSALIAARIQAAYDAGCAWVVSETARLWHGDVNTATANLERAGLSPLYARQGWIWTNPAYHAGYGGHTGHAGYGAASTRPGGAR